MGKILAGAGLLAAGTVLGLVIAKSRSAKAALSGQVTSTLTLVPGQPAAASVARGNFAQVLAPAGAQLASFAPSQAFVDAARAQGFTVQGGPQAVTPGQSIILTVPQSFRAGSYDFNVTWRSADGSPQATVVTIAAF